MGSAPKKKLLFLACIQALQTHRLFGRDLQFKVVCELSGTYTLFQYLPTCASFTWREKSLIHLRERAVTRDVVPQKIFGAFMPVVRRLANVLVGTGAQIIVTRHTNVSAQDLLKSFHLRLRENKIGMLNSRFECEVRLSNTDESEWFEISCPFTTAPNAHTAPNAPYGESERMER